MKLNTNRLLKSVRQIDSKLLIKNLKPVLNGLKKVPKSTYLVIPPVFLGGWISRQPEVNKLHGGMERLQEELKKANNENEKLNMVWHRSHEQYSSLKIRYDTLKIYNRAEKLKAVEGMQSTVFIQYAGKEYIELERAQKKGCHLSHSEAVFYASFEKFLDGKEPTDKDIDIVSEYIGFKYKKEIKELIEYDFTQLLAG